MAVDLGTLAGYVGFKVVDGNVYDFESGCITTAIALVNNYVGSASVPTVIKDQAILLAASELYHRRSAPNGIAQFASMDGSPFRVAKDPMNAVYPLLLPFVKVGL
jgi:hypothetical protein